MGKWIIVFASAWVFVADAVSLNEAFVTPESTKVTVCDDQIETASRMAAPSEGSGFIWGGYTHASVSAWQGSILISGNNHRMELYAVGSGGDDATSSANYRGTYAYTLFDASGGTVPDAAISLSRIRVNVQRAASGQSLRWLVRDDAGQWFLSATTTSVSSGIHSINVADLSWLRVDASAEAYMNTSSNGVSRVKTAIADPASLVSISPDLSAVTGGGFYVESGDENSAEVENFILNEITWESDQIELISPLDAMEVTDIALSFRWWRLSGEDAYHLQVSSDAGFSTLLIDELVFALPGDDPQADGKAFWNDYQQVGYLPETVLPADEYYWRVRPFDTNNVAHGPWSAVRSVVLNEDHSKRLPERAISPENPLFSLEVWATDAELTENYWADYWGHIPADIKPYTCISFNRGKAFDHETWLEAYGRVKESGMNFMIMAAGPNPFQSWEPLTELEWVFQHVPNVQGIIIGESFWVYSKVQWKENAAEIIRYMNRVIQLCAKYGKYYMMADGNWMASWRWDRYFAKDERFGRGTHDQTWMDPDFLREHKAWLVFAPKSNITWDAYQMSGATQGAWLAGLFDHLGYWAESWFWRDVGFNQPFDPPLGYDEGDFKYMPPSFWNNMLMLGTAQGASVYFISGQGNTTMNEYDPDSSEPFTALWDRKGQKTPVLDNIIIPFIRALSSGALIPTKEEVLGELKIAVRPGPNDEPMNGVPSPVTYRKYDALYKGTFGVEDSAPDDHMGGEMWDIIPQTGRYPFIPILPDPVQTLSNTTDLVVVDVASLTNAVEVTALFNAYYPLRYTGDAWVNLVGDKFSIMNSKENQDVTQDFSINMEGGTITRLSGTIRPFKHILGRRANLGHSLILHANTSVTNEPTTLTLLCDSASEPMLTVEPASALLSKVWNGTELTFTLSHINYAVNIRVDLPLPVAITNMGLTAEGFYAFDVLTSADFENDIQASEDLASNGWNTVETVMNTDFFTFVDTNVPAYETRFYRIRLREKESVVE
ncbi:glycoside hydrolase family 98 domain-containing protein [Pontiella agarivorans]|uniref:Glycoside hydrolase family 98 domain-containing protein n=1 Tax=Pontiella agarivorans TaxID=3038953 RepID=A0ABU5MU08_9BACT|nr:glycoside hydrolase family 98 domain-containing protein [Pontiella agarivorans]MDZ8117704.1 glycoside hydrolase family 98 domain-containing protein [Pontiella agarivorans]